MSDFFSSIVLLVMTISSVQVEHNVDNFELSAITAENVGELVQLIEFDLPGVMALDWSADSTQLLISTYEGIWLLEMTTMELEQVVELDEIARYDVAFVQDTNWIAVAHHSELILYDLDTLDVERIIPERGSIQRISDDGTLYATISSEQFNEYGELTAESIGIYALKESTLLLETPVTLRDACAYACSHDVAFSPDNSQIAFAAAVPEMESGFVNLATGDKQSMPSSGHWGIAYSPDSTLIATQEGIPGYIPDALLLIDTQTAQIVRRINVHNSSSPAFSHSGELIAIGAYDDDAPNPDNAFGFVYFFDVQQILFTDAFNPAFALSFTRPQVSVAFSPDDQILAVGNGDGKLSLWGVMDNP